MIFFFFLKFVSKNHLLKTTFWKGENLFLAMFLGLLFVMFRSVDLKINLCFAIGLTSWIHKCRIYVCVCV